MTTETGYTLVRKAARELMQGDERGRSFQVGGTHITMSKVRVLESAEPVPEPYPQVDLPPADDYSTWLK
ncbi:MAG: hypothetical protein IV093_02945 [Rubrivivax sp.]|nr:hypothetical protein [Rubrivivax sp.]